MKEQEFWKREQRLKEREVRDEEGRCEREYWERQCHEVRERMCEVREHQIMEMGMKLKEEHEREMRESDMLALKECEIREQDSYTGEYN